MAKLQDLRIKHPSITYSSYAFAVTDRGLELNYVFSLENGPTFQPQTIIEGVKSAAIAKLDQKIIELMVFNIGLVELLSYWKAACCPTIKIEAGQLTQNQLAFWQKLLIKGMGEYFYVNQIDFTQNDLVNWQVAAKNLVDSTEPDNKQNQTKPSPTSFLIPIGGGKDSVVTIKLLQKYQAQNPAIQLTTLAVNPTPAAQKIMTISGLPQIIIRRQLDPQLKTLNAQGYLNGHTPFSALLAFLTTLTAYVAGYQAVAVSNEQSANEESLQYLGHSINHQYSKSYEFETDFQRYVANLPELNTPESAVDQSNKPLPYYFSLLRPLTELKIAQLFAELTTDQTSYRESFISCNRGGATGSWCGKCAKCLFAYIIFLPFVGIQAVERIFGQDLLAKPGLAPILAALVGQTEQKPLDCVGLRDESRAALYLAVSKYEEVGLPLPVLLQNMAGELKADQNLAAMTQKLLQTFYTPHSIPDQVALWLKNEVK